MQTPELDVSVIIVNWNTRDILRDCLRSVYEQTCDIAFEVIVIDNASSDGSAAMVKAEFPQVILIANQDNRGFAAANNQGMAIAKGRYLLLLNPDTIVLDHAVQKTMEYADHHPDVGVVGCQVWENDHDIQMTCFPFPSVKIMLIQVMGLRRMFPRSRRFGWINYGEWDRDTEREVDVVSGMFMLVRRSAIDQIGLMDEDYFVYAEETDWCYRFKKAGWRCVFAPVARIIHRDGGNKSTDLVKVKMYVQMQKSILIFHRKNLGIGSWFAAKMIYLGSMFSRLLLFGLLSILGMGRNSSKKAAQSLAAVKFHLFGAELQ
jgi:GT2 family glycosyltransferase